MEGVGQDVMKDEHRRADRGVSIREMQFYPGIQVLLAEVRQIIQCLPSDLALQDSCVGDGWPAGGVLVLEGKRLQRVDPKSFAVEDMNHLCACGGKPEAGNFSRIVAGGECRQVVEQESEARVGPVVEFANTSKREQGKPPFQI
jgi:hypothetical protein